MTISTPENDIFPRPVRGTQYKKESPSKRDGGIQLPKIIHDEKPEQKEKTKPKFDISVAEKGEFLLVFSISAKICSCHFPLHEISPT